MIAEGLRSIRFCQSSLRDDGTVLRERRFGSTLLVSAANVWLAAQRDRVRFLQLEAWLDHETTMYAARGIDVQRTRSHGLIVPCFPGHTLRAHLADASHGENAFALALAALLKMHESQLSHGDAHVGNVIVCLNAQKAEWIDFETVHLDKIDPPTRLADDLRALIESSLEGSSVAMAEQLAAIVKRSTIDLETLKSMLRRQRASWYERAQGNPRPEQRRSFLACL